MMMTDTQANPDVTLTNRISTWLKQNRIRLQALTLVVSISAPFGLHWALQSGQDRMAVAFFAVTMTSLITVIVVG
jgi:hypothetical protein